MKKVLEVFKVIFLIIFGLIAAWFTINLLSNLFLYAITGNRYFLKIY